MTRYILAIAILLGFTNCKDKPAAVNVITPASVVTTPDSTNSLLFTLKGNGYLSYHYIDGKNNNNEIRIEPVSAQNIYTELNKIEKEYSIDLHKTKILVKGSDSALFKDFTELQDGMRQKKLYKYNLFTEKP